MRTITIVVERDEDGRLTGTVEATEGEVRSSFTGVIELVAKIEEILESARPAPDDRT